MSLVTGKSVEYLIKKYIKDYGSLDKLLMDASETQQPAPLLEGVPSSTETKIRSIKGFLYERIWDICIKFGVVDELTLPIDKEIHQTMHVFNNPNISRIDFNSDFWKANVLNNYLQEPIISSNSGGYSDITFLNKKNGEDREELVFISVKYFEKSKAVSNYDIGKLCTLIDRHNTKGSTNRNIKLMIFVKNKLELIEKFKKQNLSSDIMLKYLNPSGGFENILDSLDLQKYYLKLRTLLEIYNFFQTDEDINNFNTKYLGSLKNPFIPRFHQELFIEKINELLLEKKNVLVGAIPRSGKSFIMMGTILKYIKSLPSTSPKKNFLLITPAPTETFPEYKQFNNYIDFDNNNIKIITIENGKTKETINASYHNIIIVSKQRLGYKQDKKELKNIKTLFKSNPTSENIKIELIFLDEAHFGLSTDESKNILSEIKLITKTEGTPDSKIPIVFVTATYNKPLREYGVLDEAKLTWDINDINIMKNYNEDSTDIQQIKRRFGSKLYDEVLSKYNIPDLVKSYQNYPKPYLITSIWDSQYLNQEKMKIGDTNYGFDMEKLFTVNGGQFENEQQIISMFRYYFGIADRDEDYKYQNITKTRGILPRIKNICMNQCRTQQLQNKPTSQLWFLPYGPKRPIENTIKALLTLLIEDNKLKEIKENYHFFVAQNGNYDDFKSSKNITVLSTGPHIKQQIQDTELELKLKKKKNGEDIKGNNLIILAGAKLQLGISLKNVDIVTLWNTVTSSDAIFQMLFRSMTEIPNVDCRENAYCENKKFGFMVDLNPQRSLTNVLLFNNNITASKKSEESLLETISDLVNIDEDVLLERYDNSSRGKKDFTNDMLDKLYTSWNKNTESMRKLTEKIVNYDESILEEISSELKNAKLANRKTTETLVSPDGFNKSKKVKKTTKPKESDKSTKKKKKEIPLKIYAAEVLNEYLSLLNIYTLYNEGNCLLNFKKITNSSSLVAEHEILKREIYSNEENKSSFLKILSMRLGGDPNEEYSDIVLEKLISSINSTDTSKLSINKLMSAQRKRYYTIENPAELLEFINENLTPKDEERKKHGEVFTPMWLVNEMLDKLPNDVWSKKHYKWLDPAVGIGNFPVAIYLRLMKGLKTEIPNEEERRKHILENMLYMIDISDKNIFVLKKILCGNKYKLNIHKGSFFYVNKDGSDDYKKPGSWTKSFKISTFDCIVGNPPYNKGGTGTGGGTFWKYFVELSIELLQENGYLNFVHPLGWRKPIGEKASGGDVFEKFKRNGILIYVNISDEKIPYFPKVDYYVFKKQKVKFNTLIDNTFMGISHNGIKIDFNELEFIPNLVSPLSINIVRKVIIKGDNFKFNYDQKLKPSKEHTRTNGIPHAWFFIPSENKYKEVFLTRDEVLDLYSTKKERITKLPEFYSKSKIVLTYSNGKKPTYLYPLYFSKEIGVTNNTIYKIIKSEEKNKYLKFFDSKLILFLMKITQYTESPNHKNEYKIINMIDKSKFDKLPENPSNEDIYKIFGINEKEQKLIDDITRKIETKPKTKKVKRYSPTGNNNVTKLSYGKPPMYSKNNNNNNSKPSSPNPKKTAKVSVNSSTNKPASKKKTVVYKKTENQTLGNPFKHSDGSKEEFGDEEEKKRLCTESDKCSGLTSNKTKKKPVKFKMRQGKSVKPTPGAFTLKKWL